MRRALALAAILYVLAGCDPPEEPRKVEAGRLGHVEVFAPQGDGDAFVYTCSRARTAGHQTSSRLRARSRTAAQRSSEWTCGATSRGSQRLARQCHYVVAELKDLSHRFQRELGNTRYRSPILAGVGAGGTLATAALAQAPAATLAGAAAVDPAPSLATRVPLCAGATSHAAPEGGFAYESGSDLPGWLRTAPTDPAHSPAQRLVAVVEAAAAERGEGPGDVSDLPLVEIPAPHPSRRLAAIYSGDGGWRDLDKQIGEYFAAHGTPTVGVDSLRYFWAAKTPAQVAHDLSRILAHYREAWGSREILLVGYSFGAGILPAAVNRLSESDRASVVQVSLLGLEPRAPFEIAVEGWLGGLPEASPEVLPELLRLDRSRVQCFYGEEEEQTLCRDPELAGAEIIRTEGGHHFDGDYEALAGQILTGAERRAAAPPP